MKNLLPLASVSLLALFVLTPFAQAAAIRRLDLKIPAANLFISESSQPPSQSPADINVDLRITGTGQSLASIATQFTPKPDTRTGEVQFLLTTKGVASTTQSPQRLLLNTQILNCMQLAGQIAASPTSSRFFLLTLTGDADALKFSAPANAGAPNKVTLSADQTTFPIFSVSCAIQ